MCPNNNEYNRFVCSIVICLLMIFSVFQFIFRTIFPFLPCRRRTKEGGGLGFLTYLWTHAGGVYNVNRMATNKLFFHCKCIGFDKRTLLAPYIWRSVCNREKSVSQVIRHRFFIFRAKVLSFQKMAYTRGDRGSELPQKKNCVCATVSKMVNTARKYPIWIVRPME